MEEGRGRRYRVHGLSGAAPVVLPTFRQGRAFGCLVVTVGNIHGDPSPLDSFAMRRFVLLHPLLVPPLQGSWAAVADACRPWAEVVAGRTGPGALFDDSHHEKKILEFPVHAP